MLNGPVFITLLMGNTYLLFSDSNDIRENEFKKIISLFLNTKHIFNVSVRLALNCRPLYKALNICNSFLQIESRITFITNQCTSSTQKVTFNI